MDQYPHLSRAPIVEAVIDFRAKLPAAFKLEEFQSLRERLAEDYPGFEQQHVFEQVIRQEAGQVMEFSTRVPVIHGYRLLSKDGKNVAQFRRDGFTFSRLNPYTEWQKVFEEAWRLWRMYCQSAKPLEISRLAVRYINRLRLPTSFTDPSQYLNAPPLIAEGWPSIMRTFLSRIVVYEPDSGISVNVIQALDPQGPSDQTTVGLLFDVDAYQDLSLSAEDATIKERFDRLRDMKNRVFFSGLTPKAIELFK